MYDILDVIIVRYVFNEIFSCIVYLERRVCGKVN